MEKVVITVDTKGPGASGEDIFKEYVGDYYQQGEYHYIIYTDEIEESQEKIKTMLKFKADYLKVTRTGALKHQQEFQRGLWHDSVYATPFGDLNMSHETKDLIIRDLGYKKIKLIYDLYINDIEQGVMEINMKITPVH